MIKKILRKIRNQNLLFKIKKFERFNSSKNWYFVNNIYHTSQKFFKINGYKITTNYPKKNQYFQPLIKQDVGYLALIRKKINNNFFYLIQIKPEPGNHKKFQLSPTIQATKSNYTKVHKGSSTNYLEYIKKKNILINKLQHEQGSRFLGKNNRNILLEVNKKIFLKKNFIWLNLKQLIYLSKKNYFLNMDLISIFSCSLKKSNSKEVLETNSKIFLKINNFKKKFFFKLKKVSLYKMKDWIYTNSYIKNTTKLFFSIFLISVKTSLREVSEWDQPILSDYSKGLNILVTKKKNNLTFFLLQIILEPGYSEPKFASTIFLRNYLTKKKFFFYSNDIYKNIKKIKKKTTIKFFTSDEGGRFYHNKIENIVYEVNENFEVKNNNYAWLSYNQVLKMINLKKVTIECRNLFALLNLENI